MATYQDKYQFKVTWEPFFLRPNIPLEGIEKPSTYGPNNPGSQRLIQAGKAVGVDFTYKCSRFPNTLLAHCALDFALNQDPTGEKQNQLQEALFKSYFTDGEYPDSDKVCSLAAGVGLNGDNVKTHINNIKNQEKIIDRALLWSSDGVSGVPFFIINDQKVFSGAQDPESFLHVFDKIAEKFPSKV